VGGGVVAPDFRARNNIHKDCILAAKINWSAEAAELFFLHSDLLDHAVLRPISHVMPNWELIQCQDSEYYEEEADSFAAHLNVLIQEISRSSPPRDYHAYENRLAINYSEVTSGRFYLDGKLWRDRKTGNLVQKDFVGHMIEQATCGHYDVPDLVLAASGRIAASLRFGVDHFDKLDHGHMEMLSVIMTDILFRRSDRPAQ
jgi:hypothetical protein